MNSQKLLSALLKASQAGQVEIRSILHGSMAPSLRSTLHSQLQEYDAIETEALTIALQRGWDLKELTQGRRFLLEKTTRWTALGRNTDSGIAEHMIRKNTDAMINALKILHQSPNQDRQISILSQKALDCEKAHIQQLQSYL